MPYDIIIGRNESDKALFGKKGLVYLGKSYVTMGQYTSLSNPIYLDIARSHVVLVSGKRGSGKCLSGDSLITLADGSLKPIKELEKDSNNIFSLNNNLKLNESKKSEFFSREVNKLLKIKLRSGKEIKLTPEHPLLTIGGWQNAKDLNLGSRIATPRVLPCFGKENLEDFKVKILSYLLAEGHLSNGFVLFSNFDSQIIKDFKDSIQLFDSNLKINIHSKAGCFRISQIKKDYVLNNIERNSKGQILSNPITYQKSSLAKWLIDLEIYNKLSKEKFIPSCILKLNKEKLSLFLNRLFSCDGSIYKKRSGKKACWQISYCSSSEVLIKQVQNLLLRFGILSKLRDKNVTLNSKKFKSFELIIGSTNVVRFIEEIGFFGKKSEREFLAKSEMKIFNPNVDTIPKEIWETYKPTNWAEVGRKLSYKYPKAMRERINYCPSRNILLQIAEADNSNPLKLIAMSDIFWDEIISMEIMEGKFIVYDLSVPENHNFVANDIIVHNSYTLGGIAEAISTLPREESQNICSLMFDTMGIFWTMKFKNQKDKELLDEWGLKAQNVPIRVFAPFGYFQEYKDKGIPVDAEFAIKISEMQADDWLSIFNLSFTDPIAVLIEKIITELSERESFNFEDISNSIQKNGQALTETKNSAIALFEAAKTWRVFSETKGISISELVFPGTSSVIDLSMYSSIGTFNVRALIIGLVCRKLFEERMASRRNEEIQAVQHGLDYLYFNEKREMPLVWIFIDESHEFLVKEGKTPASDALIQLLREGRQPGISLVLATQQPGKIHTDALTQSDIVLSHRVTAQLDVQALNEIMQSYLFEGIKTKLDNLPKAKGSAIILDDNSERIYPMRVRPRFTWHGGEAPTAVRIEKEGRI